MRKIRRLAVLGSVAGAMVAAMLVPPALSTTGSGVSSSEIARGKGDTKIRSHAKKYDIVVANLTFQPGGHSGWHSHPGQVIVVIKSGTFTTYFASSSDDDDDEDGDDDDNDNDNDNDKSSCKPHVFKAGEVYVDSGGNTHIARNEGTVPLEVTATYLDVPRGGAVRIDEPKPSNCPF
jgi:hypothetical protein